MKSSLAFILLLVSCTNPHREDTQPDEEFLSQVYERQIDSTAIFDSLKKHEHQKHYETDFMEVNSDLRSFLYQGIVNGKNFAIKTNCTDGIIVTYLKRNNKWMVNESIDEHNGWNFKTFLKQDLNQDHFDDIILIDHDSYRRVVFLYDNKTQKIIHTKRLDRLN